jgi:uncharacterized membrane protein YedE/YeeE
MTIFLAILLGGFFGFALHRAGASHSDNILRMLTLKDLYLAKAIFFGIGLTTVFAWAAVPMGLLDPGHFSVKATHLGVLVGGLIFGVGFAMAGYCPGTSLAALGRGRRDAVVYIVGGLLGAFAYMLAHGSIVASGLLEHWDLGKVTLAATGSSYESLTGAWLMVIAGLAMIGAAAILPRRQA